MAKNFARCLCAVIGAFILTLIIASPASASGSTIYLVYSPGNRVDVAFFSHGEHLTVYDIKDHDGYYAWAVVDRYDTTGLQYYRTGSAQGSDHNFNMAEGTTIAFKACYGTASGPISCSGWKYGTA